MAALQRCAAWRRDAEAMLHLRSTNVLFFGWADHRRETWADQVAPAFHRHSSDLCTVAPSLTDRPASLLHETLPSELSRSTGSPQPTCQSNLRWSCCQSGPCVCSRTITHWPNGCRLLLLQVGLAAHAAAGMVSNTTLQLMNHWGTEVLGPCGPAEWLVRQVRRSARCTLQTRRQLRLAAATLGQTACDAPSAYG